MKSRSLWDESGRDHSGDAPAELASLDGADLYVVGAGYTGLWSALHYSDLRPGHRIVIVEAEHVGFGASGRNGGWCSSYLPMSLPRIASMSDARTAARLQRLMHCTVADIGAFIAANSIDCDWAKGGSISVIRSPRQLGSAHDEITESRQFDLGEEHMRMLDARQTADIIVMDGSLGSVFRPASAVIHPRKLVDGLANVLRRRGITIAEGVRVDAINDRALTVVRGSERAVLNGDAIALCTEAWTSRFSGHRRSCVPVYSQMIATAPLDQHAWEAIGLHGRTTFTDGRRVVLYGQRTADGRLALGSRATYHYASRIAPKFEVSDSIARHLRDELERLFPVLAGIEVTHDWGGPLAAARDWTMSVEWDPSSGIGRAGGYLGDGVAASHLAARTLVHLITGTDSELVRLPIANHHSPRWEHEPFRWLGINAMSRLASSVDRREGNSGLRPAAGSGLLDRLTGG